MCQAVLCNEPEPCVEDWKAEQQGRLEAIYAPILPPDDMLRRAAVAEMRRENALKPIPDPVCKECGYPIDERDRDPLYKRRCSTCGCQRLEKIIQRIHARLGRKATLTALKKLARGK